MWGKRKASLSSKLGTPLSIKGIHEDYCRCDSLLPLNECRTSGYQSILCKYPQPENLLLTSNTPEGLLKLADFGISKIISDEMLTTNCGTPIYMAPEIWSGKAYDNKVDVWSLGVIMYYMLSGTHPFMGDTESIGERIQFDELSFNEGVWTKISCKGN